MCGNKLTINYSKTQFIVFGTKSATAALKKKQPTIVFGDNLLECKSQVKNLGVIFDSTLSFEYQIFVSVIIIFEKLYNVLLLHN